MRCGLRRARALALPIGLLILTVDALPESLAGGSGSSKHGALRDIQQYVLDYAPYVHLHKNETFWPSDINEHLRHITPYVHEKRVPIKTTVEELAQLNELDGEGGKYLYLTSNDYIDLWKDENIKDLPGWLTSEYGIPVNRTQNATRMVSIEEWREDMEELEKSSASSHTLRSTAPDANGRSAAPGVLIVVEKPEGVVDAFWFYFYSYNLGNSVFNYRFGNHVGDWEHSVVRFRNGEPESVYLSEHEWAKAYTYEAVEKIGKRPVIYAASGTHANYGTPWTQPYGLPLGLLHDSTSKGPLWDPTLNMYSYHYNTTLANNSDLTSNSLIASSAAMANSHYFNTLTYPGSLIPDPQANTLTPSSLTPDAPTSWFYYTGHWGDQALPNSDPRQYHFFKEKAYGSGPLGPRFKALGRKMVCPHENDCVILHDLNAGWKLRMLVNGLCIAGIVGLLVEGVLITRSCLGCWRRRRTAKEAEVPRTGSVVSEIEPLLGRTRSRGAVV
jgi:hypothetical protein